MGEHNSNGKARKPSREYSLTLFNVSHQCTMIRVFIGDGSPTNPRNLHCNTLQQLYSWNIPRTRPYFYIIQWITAGLLLFLGPSFVRHHLPTWPSPPSGASCYLRLTRRRPWHPWLVLRFNARVVPSSRVLGFRAEGRRRPASSLLALGLGFSPACLLIFTLLRRPDRRWCPQQNATRSDLA